MIDLQQEKRNTYGPTSASIVFADTEALVKALGGTVSEREGSRVRVELNGE